MINTRDVSIQMITTVARRLGNLREKVVFVGGCAMGLFITDPAMPKVRVTKYWTSLLILLQGWNTQGLRQIFEARVLKMILVYQIINLR
jgi:hypothetical protein